MLLTGFAWALAIIILIPAAMLALETVASFFPHRRREGEAAALSVAIIVPAHDEGAHMKATLADLGVETRRQDRLIVVADNCADDTAEIARACGAEVFVRDDPARRGKGYALQFAIDSLKAAPPEVVAFFDADCRVAPGTLARLAGLARATGRPAQALYLMSAGNRSDPGAAIAAFAWILINQARMTGLSNLADVTRFSGSGFAAPWAVVADLDFASAGITEDMTLSAEMIARGSPPLFAPDAVVTSVLPERPDASVKQRARWEHGALGVMWKQALPTLMRGAAGGDFRAVMFGLDLLIPPMAVFGALLAAAAALAAASAPVAGLGPLAAAGLALALYVLSLAAAWLRHGRDVLPPAKFIGLAPFLLQKLKIYGREGRSSTKGWTRTDRGGPGGEG